MFDSKFDCVHNAYLNVLNLRKEGISASVVFVISSMKHAYIVVNDEVFCGNYTCRFGYYPELTFSEIDKLLNEG